MFFDFITIGSAIEDISFYTKEGVLLDNKKDILRQKLLAFEYGAKIKVDKSFSGFGGGASNSAVNLSGLGFKTAILACVGNDYRGKKVIDNFKNKGVYTNLIQIDKNKETGFSFLLIAQRNEHIAFSNRGASDNLSIGVKEKKYLKKTKWIYLTSLRKNWEVILKSIFYNKKAKIAWNPGNIQVKAGVDKLGYFLKKVDVLCLNKDEAIELVISHRDYKKKSNKFLNNINNLLKCLKGMGPSIVVVTRGKDGADCYDGDKFYHQDSFLKKNQVDTTGVGDAFNSSFVAGLEIYKGDIRKSLRLGAKNSASVITKQGAQNGLLTKKNI